MNKRVRDPCLSFRFRSGELIGINGSYADDLLHVGNDQLISTVSPRLQQFETSGNDEALMLFAGIYIQYSSDPTYAFDQLSYVSKRTQLHGDATFK